MKPMMLNVISSAIILAGASGVMASDSLRLVATLRGETPGDHLGGSMAGVGDVNGDGLADFLVGDARSDEHPGTRRCMLYFGSSLETVFPFLVVYQPETDTTSGMTHDDRFGAYVTGGCDVNADGYSDSVVSSPRWFWDTGEAYLYHGRSDFLRHSGNCLSLMKGPSFCASPCSGYAPISESTRSRASSHVTFLSSASHST